MSTADFLVEIGTEELPPKALRSLMQAFGDGLQQALTDERLGFAGVQTFASPRRLAVLVEALAVAQEPREVEQKGPPVKIAFDKDGKPSKAGLAFAARCGVDIDQLEREETPKGEWLVYRATESGQAAAGIIPGAVERALDGLPIPRRMRWGDSAAEFVRPVHWVLMLHGDEVVPGQLFGIAAGRNSQVHRFMGDDQEGVNIERPADYLPVLEQHGHVIADFSERRRRIVAAVDAAATAAGGTAVSDDDLFDEVCALTEWPVAITGSFDAAFLELPREVIVATLTGHQRYFPVAGRAGALLPVFVTVANIESPEPERVRDGNERVILPRLADAAFFWEQDRKKSLADRQDDLANVVYQQGLGTLSDKSRRVAMLAAQVAAANGSDPLLAERAAMLAKCDLVTGIVGEFPELQGTIGQYYAAADKEPGVVVQAIGEQYLPRFAGDGLPVSAAGQALAIADKLDTLCGIFALGKKPSGNRDPFGLRRAALGIVRIIVEGGIELDIRELVQQALDAQPARAEADIADAVIEFLVERLRGWYLDQQGSNNEAFEAVRARSVASLTDFVARIAAVAEFAEDDSAESLAAANKRIANILRKADNVDGNRVDPALLTDDAERQLASALTSAQEDVLPLHAQREYTSVMNRLSQLREPVDMFFDDVMVMTEDSAVRNNRLALLASLREEFLKIADISRLSISKG